MATHLVVSRARFREYDQLAEFIRHVLRRGRIDGWTATKKFNLGDCTLVCTSQAELFVALGVVFRQLSEHCLTSIEETKLVSVGNADSITPEPA
jgi:hypothetical protein